MTASLDNPFKGKKPNGTAPPPGPDPNAARLDRLERQLEQSMSALAQTNQTLAALASRLTQPAPPPTPEPTPDPEQDLAQLNSNPRGWAAQIARQEAARALQEQQGTTVQMAHSLGQTILETQRSKIESQWGPDAWSKVVQPQLKPMLDQLGHSNPLALANAETVGKLVSMVVGENVDSLSEVRATFDASEREAVGKAKEALVNDLRTQLPAPGLAPRRRQPGGDPLDPSQIPGLELMVKEHTQAGDPLDPKEVAQWHSAGNTLSDVLPLLNSEGKSNE